MVTKTSII